MTKYVYLLQQFLSLGGYDTSYLSYGDTDLVSLREDENLLVIFNNNGDEDLFMIFDPEGVTITFGQWYETLHGNDFSTFEYLVEIIREILNGNYYVKEIRLDNIDLAFLISDETDQIIDSCIISGKDELVQLSAFDFIQGLDYSEAYFDEVHWDSTMAAEEEDTFYWWDDDANEEESDDMDDDFEAAEFIEYDGEDEENDHEEHEHDHHCSCGHCHH